MYYFPVKINGRRIHYCELANANERENRQIAAFNFLVQRIDNTALLLFKWDSWLISERGHQHNVKIKKLGFSMTRKNPESDDDDAPVEYELSVKKERNPNRNGASDDGVLVLSHLGDNDGCLGIDTGKFDEDNLKLTIVFHDGNIDYSCTMTFNIYVNPEDVVCAALDFGSEASQMRVGTAGGNLPLVDIVRKVANSNPNYPNKYKDDEYWQGKIDDQYFKSIFWVKRQNALMQLAEIPMANGPETFIQMLNTYQMENTNGLYPLPNLKLLELAPNIADYIPIRFLEGTPPGINAQNLQLNDIVLQDDILHLLITYFLHSLLHYFQGNCNRDLYLQFVVLAPNVYSQEKVYGIVEKLYRDFEIIKSEGLYPSIKGIEVQTLSESDASFLGYRSRFRGEFNDLDKYYLIIDAGKGTTDFSVIKGTDDRTKFDSIYRCGIPASGNVLTHSFYEAIREIKLENEELSIDKIIDETKDFAKLIDLQKALDFLKFQYESLPKGKKDSADNKKDDTKNIKSINNFDEMITFLGEVAQGKETIPNLDYHVVGPNSNLEVLTGLLRNALEVIKSQGIVFDKVILTGRGFCFKPFADRVVEMLLEEKLIDSPNSVLKTPNADLSKSICMDGTLQSFADWGVEINHKSLLVGSPVVSYRRFKFFKVKKKPVSLSEDFYFKGYKNKVNGFDFLLNGRTIQVGRNRSGGRHRLFFVGSTFLEQEKNATRQLTFQNQQINVNNTLNCDKIIDLVRKSLFPFNRQYN